jgi:hypothetical protein
MHGIDNFKINVRDWPWGHGFQYFIISDLNNVLCVIICSDPDHYDESTKCGRNIEGSNKTVILSSQRSG